MGKASAEQVREMDNAISELRRQYKAAAVKVQANTTGWFVSAEAQSVGKAFNDVGAVLERWATTYRNWALAGQRDNGTAYDVAAFLAFGRTDVADAVQLISGEAYDRSLFAAVAAAAKQTAEDVKPTNWPVGVQVGAAVAVVVGVVVAVELLKAALRRG